MNPKLSLDRGPLPLSFQQAWWLWWTSPNNRSDLLDTFAIRLTGPLDPDILRRSIDELTKRHESLRSTLSITSVGAAQTIHSIVEDRTSTLQIIDMSHEEIDEVRGFVGMLAKQPRNLEVGPLFEAILILRSRDENLLVFRISHSVHDGWSLAILFAQLWQCYAEFLGRRLPSAPGSSMQISDYLEWQRQEYGTWLKKYRSYWSRHLEDAVGIMWPLRNDAPLTNSGEIAQVNISFTADSSANLRESARRSESLLSLVMMSIYVITISQLCQQHDFVFQILVNGRDRLEHRNLIGMLAHPVFLRMQLTGAESFIEVLGLVSREYYRTLFYKDFGNLIIENPHLTADTGYQWLPWPPDRICGIPELSEDATLGISGAAFPFEATVNYRENFTVGTFLYDAKDINGGIWYAVDRVESDFIHHFVSAFCSAAEQFAHDSSVRIPEWAKSRPDAQ